MKTLRALIALCLLSTLVACGDTSVPSGGSDVPDAGVDVDASEDISTLDVSDTEACPDDDSDGVCDDLDQCPDGDDGLDADEDGTPDGCDLCAGSDDNEDADADSVPDGCDACEGSPDSEDSDADGVPDGCDVCEGGDDTVDSDGDGVPNACDDCDDSSGDTDGDGVPDDCDPCPADEFDDSDGDGVCDSDDLCDESDDGDDADGDGVPDGCDLCPDDATDDSDGDGVCDSGDICEGFDDLADEDEDLVPDGCDACEGSPDSVDGDIDGVPDGCDRCTAGDDSADGDDDGTPDLCDCDASSDVCHEEASCADGIDGVLCTCNEGFEGDGISCGLVDCGIPEGPLNGGVDYVGTTYGESATQYCDEGYRAEDPDTRVCRLDGTWSGSVAACELVDCGELEAPENGTLSVGETTYGETAIHSCDAGYELGGDALRVCQADGSWSGTVATCDPLDCGTLEDIEFGSVSVVLTTFGASAIYSCEQGYEILGVAERVCSTDGAWSREEPSCVPVDCGTLEAPENGSVDAEFTTFESIAVYGCAEGHILVGVATRECTSEGVWDEEAPTCEATSCGPLAPPSNGAVTFDSALFGDMATYTCSDGYVLAGSETRLCGADGSWSGVAATCDPVDCGDLDAPENGDVVAPITTLGAAAIYLCDTGHSRVGDLTRTCGPDGDWTGSAATCAPVDCGDLSAPANGRVDVSETTFESIATYVCDAGYDLAGATSRTCLSSGSWSDSAPTCVAIDCGTLSAPANGSVAHSGTAPGSTATFACDAGYDLVGSTTRTCELGGTWSGSSPSCSLIDCGGLSAPVNGTVSVASTAFGGTATYSCATGYTLAGSAARVCLETGFWSGAAPVCPPVDCGAPPSPSNGSVSFGSTTYTAVASYSCDAGFSLSGSATRTCQSSATWSGSTPTCSGGIALPCVCGGAFFEGQRVQAIVSSPSGNGLPIGATGTVVMGGSGNPPILVQWDGWSGGHGGNCSYYGCGTRCSDSGSSRWFVQCDEIGAL